ncbi:MAG: hypothetical protein ACYSU7_14660 [Planctomycetota bacterium]
MRRPGSVLIFVLVLIAAGCNRRMYNPELATRSYPHDLHRPESVDIQVFRDGPSLEIVNATARSYRDFDLWVNQRYVHRLPALPAGETIRVSLWDFYDVRGDRYSAGGLWRTEPPMPLRLAQIQEAEDEPLIGLIAIPED